MGLHMFFGNDLLWQLQSRKTAREHVVLREVHESNLRTLSKSFPDVSLSGRRNSQAMDSFIK